MFEPTLLQNAICAPELLAFASVTTSAYLGDRHATVSFLSEATWISFVAAALAASTLDAISSTSPASKNAMSTFSESANKSVPLEKAPVVGAIPFLPFPNSLSTYCSAPVAEPVVLSLAKLVFVSVIS